MFDVQSFHAHNMSNSRRERRRRRETRSFPQKDFARESELLVAVPPENMFRDIKFAWHWLKKPGNLMKAEYLSHGAQHSLKHRILLQIPSPRQRSCLFLVL